jgi:CRP/FNR family cyclic AMP-dependent transcriptional regulator
MAMPDVFSILLAGASKFCCIAPLDCLGSVASGFVLLTFCMQNMVRLRLIALLSNITFIAYASEGGLMPILVLHSLLLLVNSASVVRAYSATRSSHRARNESVFA